jgi:hypothetical protein
MEGLYMTPSSYPQLSCHPPISAPSFEVVEGFFYLFFFPIIRVSSTMGSYKLVVSINDLDNIVQQFFHPLLLPPMSSHSRRAKHS